MLFWSDPLGNPNRTARLAALWLLPLLLPLVTGAGASMVGAAQMRDPRRLGAAHLGVHAGLRPLLGGMGLARA